MKDTAKKNNAPSAKKAAAVKPAVKKKTVAKTEKTVKVIAPVKKTAAPAKKATVPVVVKKTAAPAKKATVPVVVKKTAAPAKKEEAPVVVKKSVKKTVSQHKKNRLTVAQKKHYIFLLKELRRTFTSQLKFHQDEALTTKKDSAGERAGMATHMADLGSDNFRHDLELGLMTEEGDVLEMIEEALQKIEANEYGICADCECLINPERLEAKPYARYCVRCKNLREKMEEPHRRHR